MVDAKNFQQAGIFIQRNYLDEKTCDLLLAQIESYRQSNTVPTVFRKVKGRSLNYQVIDGIDISQHLQDLVQVYQRINEFVNQIYGQLLYPLESEKVRLNVNITPVGGEYRWHYDRNRLTAILYLNEVEGGETDIYPNFRIKVKNPTLQRHLDNLLMQKWVRNTFTKLQTVRPQKGTLVLMLGNQSLHSVRTVLGSTDRINIIASFDDMGKSFNVSPLLDNYLYQEKAELKSDPNYADAKN